MWFAKTGWINNLGLIYTLITTAERTAVRLMLLIVQLVTDLLMTAIPFISFHLACLLHHLVSGSARWLND